MGALRLGEFIIKNRYVNSKELFVRGSRFYEDGKCDCTMEQGRLESDGFERLGAAGEKERYVGGLTRIGSFREYSSLRILNYPTDVY